MSPFEIKKAKQREKICYLKIETWQKTETDLFNLAVSLSNLKNKEWEVAKKNYHTARKTAEVWHFKRVSATKLIRKLERKRKKEVATN